jgi:hypothetical protein
MSISACTRKLYKCLKDNIALDCATALKEEIKSNPKLDVDEEIGTVLRMRVLDLPTSFKITSFKQVEDYCKEKGIDKTELKIKHAPIVNSFPQIKNMIDAHLRIKNPNAKKRVQKTTKQTKKTPKSKKKTSEPSEMSQSDEEVAEELEGKESESEVNIVETGKLFESDELANNSDHQEFPSVDEELEGEVEKNEKIEEVKKPRKLYDFPSWGSFT